MLKEFVEEQNKAFKEGKGWLDAEKDLDGGSQNDDDQPERVVIGGRGNKHLFHGLGQRRKARVEHDDRDQPRADVFQPAVAEGMALVGLSAGELGADDRDDRGQRVAEVVDRVEQYGDRAGEDADQCLEKRQKNIGDDADDPRSHDDFFAFHANTPFLYI